MIQHRNSHVLNTYLESVYGFVFGVCGLTENQYLAGNKEVKTSGMSSSPARLTSDSFVFICLLALDELPGISRCTSCVLGSSSFSGMWPGTGSPCPACSH